jgi:hypothetical protein
VCGAVCAAGDEALKAGDIDLLKAARWFTEFDSVCARDGGSLWGVSFQGPILFVDPASRAVVANRADAGHLLVARSGVFVGELAAGLPIANTAVEWQGARWTMIMWPSLGDEPRPRLSLMGHESFHRLQPQLRLETAGGLNDHLDEADGRFWMQVEWNALQQALLSKGGARRRAVLDALWFRAARRARFEGAAGRENALEINEGLAEYSGRRLVGYSRADIVKVVKARREDDTGFVRSFAYITGPLYGYLLDATTDGWRKRVTPATDLGDLLAAEMGLARDALFPTGAARAGAAEAEARAAAYGGSELRRAEGERGQKRQAQLAVWRHALVEGPVLIVELASVHSGSFDPGKVYPMGAQQTVYTRRELQADWGVLRVEDGAILEDGSTGEGHVSLLGAAPDHSRGTGWALALASGWHIVPGRRDGDVRIEKK